jgi:hypothetical protein
MRMGVSWEASITAERHVWGPDVTGGIAEDRPFRIMLPPGREPAACCKSFTAVGAFHELTHERTMCVARPKVIARSLARSRVFFHFCAASRTRSRSWSDRLLDEEIRSPSVAAPPSSTTPTSIRTTRNTRTGRRPFGLCRVAHPDGRETRFVPQHLEGGKAEQAGRPYRRRVRRQGGEGFSPPATDKTRDPEPVI